MKCNHENLREEIRENRRSIEKISRLLYIGVGVVAATLGIDIVRLLL